MSAFNGTLRSLKTSTKVIIWQIAAVLGQCTVVAIEERKDMFICDNTKGLSLSRLYVASTKTLPRSTVVASSICNYVLFVELDNNSSRFE